MTHDPIRRTLRQRDSRRAERQHERHIANATLRDAVRAIGGGEADFWDQDGGEGFPPATDEKKGVSGHE